MQHYQGPGPVNLAGGQELSIREVAVLIRDVVGYEGELTFDTSRPDGSPRKVLDAAPLLELGWKPQTDLREALVSTYECLRERIAP